MHFTRTCLLTLLLWIQLGYCVIQTFDDVAKLNAKTFDRSLQNYDTFVMFYAPWCGHCKNLKPTWTDLAKKYDKKSLNIAKVDCTVETTLCAERGVKGYPTLLLFNKYSGEGTRFKSQRTLDNLESFIKTNLGARKDDAQPLITQENNVMVLNSENQLHFLGLGDWFVMFYAPWCGHCKKLKPTWETLAGENSENPSFPNIGKFDCTEGSQVCNEFGVKGYPTLLYIRKGKVLEKHDGNRDVESMKAFIEKVLTEHPTDSDDDGINERIPINDENEDEEPVMVLDDSTFQEQIKKSSLTFVKFYAPWCGHCKKLAPVWEELGKHFSDDSTVVIAKIDCTENQDACSDQSVSGYPTLKLFRDGKVVMHYAGTRSIDKLIQFVNKYMPKEEL